MQRFIVFALMRCALMLVVPKSIQVVFNSELGLAVEKLKDGITPEQLFMLTLE